MLAIFERRLRIVPDSSAHGRNQLVHPPVMQNDIKPACYSKSLFVALLNTVLPPPDLDEGVPERWRASKER